MFKLSTSPTFWKKVGISVPGEEKKSIIEIEFKYKDRDQLKDYRERTEKNSISSPEAIHEVVAGWKGVDSEFSTENLDKLLLLFPGSGVEIYTDYVQESLGIKAKN